MKVRKLFERLVKALLVTFLITGLGSFAFFFLFGDLIPKGIISPIVGGWVVSYMYFSILAILPLLILSTFLKQD